MAGEAYRLLEGQEPHGDPLVQAMAYANLYGGLVLVYASEDGIVAPISRIHLGVGIGIEPGPSDPRVVDDSTILRVWARLYRGEEEALSLLEGPLHAPRGYVWRLGGGLRVSPSGFSGVVVEEV